MAIMEQRPYMVNSSRIRACPRIIASGGLVILSVCIVRIMIDRALDPTLDYILDHVRIGCSSGRALAKSGAFMVVVAA